jgi:hypothetical protein
MPLGLAMKRATLALVLVVATRVFAETPVVQDSICVKYGPCPLNVSAFTCADVISSFIRRVCYDAPKSFMVINQRDVVPLLRD